MCCAIISIVFVALVKLFSMKTKLLFLSAFFAFQFASANAFADPITPDLPPLTYCDPNNDGFYDGFDLTMQNAAILAAQSGGANYQITYHETINDANAGGIGIIGLYAMITPFQQTLYYRVEDTVSGEYAVGSFSILVNVTPIATTPSNFVLCDDNDDGMQNFNLTSLVPEILGGLSPTVNVAFYNSLSAADAGLGQITQANSYVGMNGETIYARVTDNVTGCYDIVSFHLRVNPRPVVTTPTPLQVCDADGSPNDMTTFFDLTVKNNEISQNSGAHVDYYPSLNFALLGDHPIVNAAAYVNSIAPVQTLGVRVTSSLGCVNFTTLDIRVLPIPTPNTNPPALASQCDSNNPGDLMENFDLTVNEAYIRNGDPSLTLHYFPTMMDAENTTNEILPATAALVGANVWIRVENTRIDYQGNYCYVLVEQPLTINPLPNPIITTENNFNTVYVDESNNVVQPLLLESNIDGNYSYQWYENGNLIPGAEASTYLVNTASLNNQTRSYNVWVEDNVTECNIISAVYSVLQSDGVPPPSGQISQTLAQGSTLADIVINGTNVQWYSVAVGKNYNTIFSTPLPSSTVLVDGTTYYASQTINGNESAERLPVTVSLALGINNPEVLVIQYHPNPVKNILEIKSDQTLNTIAIYTILGQKVLSQDCNANNVNIDLSLLSSGNYILKVQSDTGQKAIRIIKE